MRKLTKTAAVVASMAVMAMGSTVMAGAKTEGWVQSGSNWYYYTNGDKASDQWVKSGDDWYFVDDEGKMVTDSFVRTDAFNGDSQVLDEDDIHDELGTDDIDDDSTFYYLGKDGKMVTGWLEMNASSIYASPNSGSATKVWYYFGATGRMYINEWVYSGDKWYALSPNGQMYAEAVVNNDLVDWDDDDNYYVDNNGAMVTGWYYTTDKIAGSYAKATKDEIVTGKKYWVYGDEETGVLADEEWKKINGKWYYFGEDARTTKDGVKDEYLNVYLADFDLDDLGVSNVASGNAIISPATGSAAQYHENKEPDKASEKFAMLKETIIAWANHDSKSEYDTSKINYFYLGKNGDALTTWMEIDDDYYICGNSKGELYQDEIAKVNGKYYYFNADAVCDYKYLNNTADYVVVATADYNAEDKLGNSAVTFYETTKASDNDYDYIKDVKLAEIKDILAEADIVSVSFGSRKVKINSLTETEAIAAYAVYDALKDANGDVINGASQEVSIYKLRTSSAMEEKEVKLNK